MDKMSLKNLSESELRTTVVTLRKERQGLLIRRSVSALENPLRLRVLRREIARCLTALSVLGGH